jgi:hypothetical protein
VEQNGKVEEVTETVMKPVYEENVVGRVAVAAAEVFEAGGKEDPSPRRRACGLGCRMTRLEG